MGTAEILAGGEVREPLTDDRPPRPPEGTLIVEPGDPTEGPPIRLRVAEGTQVGHEGTVYAAGETFTAPKGTATVWLAAGWVVEIPKVVAKTK
jgi:hypothetical protein